MRVIVTRPAAQATEWVAALREQGIDAAALPLIGIAPAADLEPVRRAWRTLGAGRRLVVFVSPNAAEQFFAGSPAAIGPVWPAGVLAASPGPGTTQALRALGVPAEAIVAPAADAPQFDSEALWASLAGHDWHGASVLVVRGDGGREWLADRLKEHGAAVETLGAYRRMAPILGPADRALLATAGARPREHLWFFSSSEAIDQLAAAAASLAPIWPKAGALATHPRIAERARRLGFGAVAEARPALSAVVACIQSWRW